MLDTIRPDHSLIARVGLIGGPGDLFGRTGYWPLRFARPADPTGRVLVPSIPGLGVQVIDVRDLAAWLIDGAERAISGVFNVGGPTLSLEEHLAVARRVAGHEGELVEAPQDWLMAHGVEPWMGPRSLPLWLETPAWAGLNSHDTSRARRTRPRPLVRSSRPSPTCSPGSWSREPIVRGARGSHPKKNATC